MSELMQPAAEACAALVEAIGIGVMTAVSIYVLCLAVGLWWKKEARESIFQTVRQRLGRGILLGLEFLVAADIIHTVAVELTFHTVGVLAVVVLIRTFLSVTLDVEITGRWPWQERS